MCAGLGGGRGTVQVTSHACVRARAGFQVSGAGDAKPTFFVEPLGRSAGAVAALFVLSAGDVRVYSLATGALLIAGLGEGGLPKAPVQLAAAAGGFVVRGRVRGRRPRVAHMI